MRLRTLTCFLPLLAFGQFQDFSFEPPGSSYTVTRRPQMIEMSRVDRQKMFYCQIVVYTSQPSASVALQDVDREWQATVAKDFKVNNATMVTRDFPLAHAPQSVVRGAESVDGNGNKAISTLYVVRFPNSGRYVGVVYNVPNATALQACQGDVARVVSSLEWKGGSAATPAPATPAPAPTPVAPTGGGTITGIWERVDASRTPTRYNPITKQWEYHNLEAMNQFRHVRRFVFEANGQYTFELNADDFNRSQRSRVIEKGTYTVSGGVIAFVPQESWEGKGPKGQDPPVVQKPKPSGASRRFLVGEHPQYKDSAGLQLQNNDGSWDTYKPVR